MVSIGVSEDIKGVTKVKNGFHSQVEMEFFYLSNNKLFTLKPPLNKTHKLYELDEIYI